MVKAAEERNAAKRMAAAAKRQLGRGARGKEAGRGQCKDCGGGGICEHGRVRSHCKACRCARAEADTQEKAAAALPRGCGRTGGRDGSGSSGVYRVYSGAGAT